MAEYQAAPGLSKSQLDDLHRSPAHYKWELEHPTEPTPAMIWGQMFHSLVLEPDVFEATYAVLPEGIDRRTREGKEIWADWQLEHVGMTPVDKPSLDTLNAMRDAVFAHRLARNLLVGGTPESSVFWTHTGHEVEAKARLDYIHGQRGLIADLKSCADARSEVFSRACWNYRYHVQAAYYLDAYKAVTGEALEDFLFVCVEKEPPHGVMLYLADGEMVDQGRKEYRADLDVYCECRDKEFWPCYPDTTFALTLPVWAQNANWG